LRRIDVVGGPPLTLCDAVPARGGTWNKNDVIVFGAVAGGIFRVHAGGGSVAPLTTLGSGEIAHRFPWFLPDGRHFLYSAQSGGGVQNAVYVADLQSKDRKRVVAAPSNTVYSPPGYLLFVREQTLMAQPFDDSKLETTSDAIPIAEHVDSVSSFPNQTQFSISQNGVLAYTSGGAGGGSRLTWFDRSGKMTGTLGAPNVVGSRPSSRFIRLEIAFSIVESSEFVDRAWMRSALQGRNPRLEVLDLHTAQAVFERVLRRAQSAGRRRVQIYHDLENGRSGCA
jgi:hypothetical protein